MVHILEKNLNKIDWSNLSGNYNAIHLLERFPNKIDWTMLALNKNAIHLLKKCDSSVYGPKIYANPGIFEPKLNIILRDILYSM